ncbi:hypothetical protein [Pinibacter soli]|uniref:Uncharacterized protein n=1 Tax=Pinibacter soli TaxID=3044211 RepID=A0ABT6R9R0_9BACT|nr:hypothetical protein [Pinibacter soli]MDI3319146.1 hypothetical protein [Pinibacter soli]
MRAITSKEKLLLKLKKNNLLTDGNIFYLSDFHKTTVGNALATKLIDHWEVEPTSAMKNWFETEWKLRKPVGKHKGVNVFHNDITGSFFFNVKKGRYLKGSYKECIEKIDYLDAIKEPLK